MKKDIKIGLIGFCIDNLKYFYSDIPFSASVNKLCTTSFERTEVICRQYGFKSAAHSEDEMIYCDDIDVIDICSPNAFHYETLKKAISAGKAVYCEKPLCLNYTQAREIAELAHNNKTICNIVFNNRHLAPIMRAKELIDEGRIGNILSFSCKYLHNSALDVSKPAGWKQRHDICGGGVLVDLGSHCIDLMYFLCGRFSSVFGESQIAFPTRTGADGKPWATDADEAFYIICNMESGARGTITASKIAIGTNDDLAFEIYGERGSIAFSLMQPNFLRFYDGSRPTSALGGDCGYREIECVGRYPSPAGSFPAPKAPSSWLRGHVQSMYDFLASVSSSVTSHPDFNDAAHVQAVIDAAYKSSEIGKTISVAEIENNI